MTKMKEAPNVMLIVLDTVRADSLSCYGLRRKLTPNIDKMAHDGALYLNAFSTAPWTPPSHASIFTGKYPSYHKTMGKDVRFKEANTSLAEALSLNGFQTLGVTWCQILGRGSGFEKGFQQYIDVKTPSVTKINLKGLPAKELIRTFVYGPDKGAYQATEAIKSFLRHSWNKKMPFFVFVNLFDAHTAYDPPRPYKERFSAARVHQTKTYLSQFLLQTIANRNVERLDDQTVDIHKLNWIASGGGGFSFAAKNTIISQKEWDIVKSWYEAEIAYLDHQIGNLISFLRNKGILENTLLVITSDHGENFGEHGLAVHPLCVYDSILHVPLIMSHPSLVPKSLKIESLCSTVDILPTVLDLAGIKCPSNIQGRTLRPFEEHRIHDFVCAEYGGLHTRGFAGLQAWKLGADTKRKLTEIDVGCKCIRTPTHKYILSEHSEELYNINEDPSEQTNIIKEHPETARSLKSQLEKAVDISYYGPKEFSGKETDKEMERRLRALGYV